MSAYVNVYFKIIFECIRKTICECHRSKVHCGSAFEPGGSGLPYYCKPPMCVPDVLGALAVWRRISRKEKKRQFFDLLGRESTAEAKNGEKGERSGARIKIG